MTFYDQGFKVELDNGKRFIANFRYSLKEYVAADPVALGAKAIKDVYTDDYDKFYSECDRTMVGFVQGGGSTMTEHHVQCFYAIKEGSEGKKSALG